MGEDADGWVASVSGGERLEAHRLPGVSGESSPRTSGHRRREAEQDPLRILQKRGVPEKTQR
jgi:hypothetical protein